MVYQRVRTLCPDISGDAAAVAPGPALCHGHGPCLVRLATHGTGTLQGEGGHGDGEIWETKDVDVWKCRTSTFTDF